jgi:hypothetical protein
MRAPHSPFPGLQTLTAGLTSVLIGGRPAAGGLTILDRQPTGQGTFPKEVVTCRLAGGRELRVFCKYGSRRSEHNCHGHRGGVAYEADVYRQVLRPLGASAPRLYGTYVEGTTGETWLILEYLDGGVRVTLTSEPAAMDRAVDWIGRFHAAGESHAARAAPPLTRYDAAYYVGWARRTRRFAGPLRRRFAWLAPLCKRFEEAVAFLLRLPPTIIHGEYYPDINVLFRGGRIYPVDWESAAIAPGEIDLVALTEGWPAAVVRRCELRYQQTRWPWGAPAAFGRALGAARLYLHFRWLGERPGQTAEEANLWRFEELRLEGERFGLI